MYFLYDDPYESYPDISEKFPFKPCLIHRLGISYDGPLNLLKDTHSFRTKCPPFLCHDVFKYFADH